MMEYNTGEGGSNLQPPEGSNPDIKLLTDAEVEQQRVCKAPNSSS